MDSKALVIPDNFELPVSSARASDVPGADRPLTFGIRPEDVHLEPGAPVEAKVHDVENHGVEKIVTLMAGDNRLRATVSAQSGVIIVETIRFAWDANKVILSDSDSGENLHQVE